jgi:hypothetical protein
VFVESIAARADDTQQYEGRCAGCGQWRALIFRAQHGTLHREDPGNEPSLVIDAGQWWVLAQKRAAGASAIERLASSGSQSQRTVLAITHRRLLEDAASSVQEIQRFLPATGEGLDERAFWTAPGRAVWQDQPTAFRANEVRSQLAQCGQRLSYFKQIPRRKSSVIIKLVIIALILIAGSTALALGLSGWLVAPAVLLLWLACGPLASGLHDYYSVRRILDRFGSPSGDRRHPPGAKRSRYFF